jgi:hypothetical protein
MRDPDRIPIVLEKIERLWQRYPDWRLGQLVANVAAWRDTDIWNIEENELTEEIDRHLRQAECVSDAKTKSHV